MAEVTPERRKQYNRRFRLRSRIARLHLKLAEAEKEFEALALVNTKPETLTEERPQC